MGRVSAPPSGRIAILGFGLIGGSIARALAKTGSSVSSVSGRPAVVAWSPSGVGPARAVHDGVIDEASATMLGALEGADLLVIAAPPLETIGIIAGLGAEGRGRLAKDAVITDVASTKGIIVNAAAQAGLRFVGGHPMAGLEATGYAAGRADLFVDRPWVIVPPRPEDPAAVARVRWLALACGARPMELGAGDHDAAVAAISHLPLVASAALVEAVAGGGEGSEADPAWPLAAEIAAGGWTSMTRLARGDARMGAGIAATNAAALAADLRRFRAVLDSWISALESADGVDATALEARLRTARARLVERDSA